jgi:hypothetical protein
MKKQSKLVLTAIVAVSVLMMPQYAHSQIQGALPSWVDDSRRAAAYPASEWFVGYALGTIGPKDKAEEVRKRVEREAQNKLAEGISVRIQAVSTAHTQSAQTRTGGEINETIKKDYGQIIQATTNAELARVEVISHHDEANKRIYALARAKKSDLAAYYSSRIEYYLQLADNDLKLAKQHGAADRKRSALEKIADAKKNVDESGNHYDLLLSVDFKGDVKRLLDWTARLRAGIAELENNLNETAPVFIGGREVIGNSESDIVIPALQNLFSQNGCRVASTRQEAGYILTVDVKDHMKSQDKNFSYCYAQVRATLLNTKTDKNDANLNFTGPKASWTNMDRACQNAMNEAVKVLWKEISTKTEVCR